MSESSTWPPLEGVTTPKVPLKDTVWALTGVKHINAPAHFIFDILLDTSAYSAWTGFIPSVTIESHPSSPNAQSADKDAPSSETDPILKLGTKFIFHVDMSTNPEKPKFFPTHLVVTDMSTPSNPSTYIPAATLASEPTYTADLGSVYRVAWASNKRGILDVGPTAERFHEIIVQGESKCEVRMWECLGGVLAHPTKWIYEKTLSAKIESWCEGLRTFGQAEWMRKMTTSGQP